jgi:integrase/recombinase XerD
MKINLAQAVDLFLETGRSFGFALVQVGVELGSLVRYAQQSGHHGPLTTSLCLDWAQQPKQCHPSYWALRLEIVGRFAKFWQLREPRTQIPPAGYFGPTYGRRAVHIYSPEEFAALCAALVQWAGPGSFLGSTLCTLLGLLYSTGLRIGEALALSDPDINWTEGVLTIHQAKNGRSRLVPVQPSTVQALQRYRRLRAKALGAVSPPRLFVIRAGKPLGYFAVSTPFRKVCRDLGWTQPPIPRLHDLRHTFAVRTLLGWYRSGEPVAPKLWILSTYLGHRHLAHTYWYLTAVPELMELCQERFALAQSWASGGGQSHE